jgi:glycosyltransferase involved in cell wall biosynthesis
MIMNVPELSILAATRKLYTRLVHQDMVTLALNKKSDKNILLSYITQPFKIKQDDPTFHAHTNKWECYQIAKIWNEFGYSVDVIDWTNEKFIPKKDYSIFIDIHSNMERIADLLPESCLKILHITGAHWLYQNTMEYQRLLDLQRRKRITLQPRRTAPPSKGIEYADCATIIGNEFTESTFQYAGKPLFRLPISSTIQFPFFENKNYEKVKTNFLWFGGSGMVHKGLDLTLEAFSQMPDKNLIICGPIYQEKDFIEAYYEELFQTPNIKTIGWMDINSNHFLDIINSNVALVYPSCSEGTAGSVVTCMHGGLIPLVSYQSGVDIGDFGITLQDCTIEDIKQSVRYISQLPETTLKQMSLKAWGYANSNFTREHFSEKYREFVSIMISQKEGLSETPI